jgi:hypothetical protein
MNDHQALLFVTKQRDLQKILTFRTGGERSTFNLLFGSTNISMIDMAGTKMMKKPFTIMLNNYQQP